MRYTEEGVYQVQFNLWKPKEWLWKWVWKPQEEYKENDNWSHDHVNYCVWINVWHDLAYHIEDKSSSAKQIK